MKENADRAKISDIKQLTPTVNTGEKSSIYLQIYQITADFIAKLLFPGVLIFALIVFRPVINILLSNITEAEVGGVKFKLTQRLEEAVKNGDTKAAEEVIYKFRSDISGDMLRNFWKPNGKDINPINQAKLRQWMADNGLGDKLITTFLIGDKYSEAREKALRELGLSK